MPCEMAIAHFVSTPTTSCWIICCLPCSLAMASFIPRCRSADLQAEMPPWMPQKVKGRIVAAGYLGDDKNPDDHVPIDYAELRLDWDIARRTLLLPIQFVSGSNRANLFAQIAPPFERDGIMLLSSMAARLSLDRPRLIRDSLTLKRVSVRIHDLAKRRISSNAPILAPTTPRTSASPYLVISIIPATILSSRSDWPARK